MGEAKKVGALVAVLVPVVVTAGITLKRAVRRFRSKVSQL
jgi:hypothetical protein